MELKALFKNQFNELRIGWQLVAFLVALAAANATVVVPVIFFWKRTDVFLLAVASLFAAVLATLLSVRVLNKKPLAAVGLAINKHTLRGFGVGCLIGWLMMTVVFGIEYLAGYTKVVAADFSLREGAQVFGHALLFFGAAALFEEVLFRGYAFQTLARGINILPAAILTGILFGLAHLRNPNASALGIVNTFLVSIVFGIAYWRMRSLWLPFGIHLAWNFSQTTLYGFPTSGGNFTRHELTRLTQYGPEWITGGAYGPEGGALATLAITLCGAYLYYSRSLQPGPDTVTLEREGEHPGSLWPERRTTA